MLLSTVDSNFCWKEKKWLAGDNNSHFSYYCQHRQWLSCRSNIFLMHHGKKLTSKMCVVQILHWNTCHSSICQYNGVVHVNAHRKKMWYTITINLVLFLSITQNISLSYFQHKTDCAVPYARHFHTGCSIFFIESELQWNMPYYIYYVLHILRYYAISLLSHSFHINPVVAGIIDVDYSDQKLH